MLTLAATTIADLAQLRPPGDLSDFVRLSRRPVFKQHTDPEGNFFGPRELLAITDHCNFRLADTGDFAPIALRHTSKQRAKDPEVVGFCGPYYMGTVGRLKPLPAILADLWVFRLALEKDPDLLKKYSRLSPEFWADENDPTFGYFDPVCLLGAETPELDLGIHYSKDTAGKRLRKYSKLIRFEAAPALPGGNNTAVPSTKKKSQFAKDGESPMPMAETDGALLSPAAVNQIVQALTPVIVETVTKMAAPPKSDDMPPAAGAVPGATAPVDPAAAPPAGEASQVPGADAVPAVPGADDQATPYAKLCQYAAGDGDDAGGAAMYAAMSEEEQQTVRASIDGEPDQDRKMKLQKYAASGEKEDDNDDPSDDDDDPVDPTDVDDEEDEEDDKPTAAKYQKQYSSLQRKYQKAVSDNRQLADANAAMAAELAASRAQASTATREGRQAKRYQKLQLLQAEGYHFDLDEEAEETMELADDAFERHCTKIAKNYQKLNRTMLPVQGSPMVDGGHAQDAAARARISQAQRSVAERRAGGDKSASLLDELGKAFTPAA